MEKHTYVVTVTLNPAVDKTATVDCLQKGGLNRVRTVRKDPGGKGINVARVLKGFGQKVEATGLLAGTQGQWILQALRDAGIESCFYETAGETRTNLKVFDESTHTITEINEPGFTVTPEDMACYGEMLSARLDRAAVLVLSGSLPPGVCEDTYGRLVELAKRKGIKVLLDADGKALANGIRAVPYAVKPNIHELEQLMGRKLPSTEDIVQAARSLIMQGIEVIVVSMGAEGALILNETAVYRAKPKPIVPQSTVGAGDSMVAALVYALLHEYSLEETARFITAAGTVTASKPGTEVCTLPEVLAYASDMQVEKLL